MVPSKSTISPQRTLNYRRIYLVNMTQKIGEQNLPHLRALGVAGVERRADRAVADCSTWNTVSDGDR